MRQRLEDLLDLERDTLADQQPTQPSLQEKLDYLDRLPHRLSEALERLKEYAFEDAQARQEFENLLDELKDIHDLEEFQRRYGDLFHGPQSLGYEEALNLMREMQRLKQLEDENRRLKQIVAKQTLDIQALKAVVAKKW